MTNPESQTPGARVWALISIISAAAVAVIFLPVWYLMHVKGWTYAWAALAGVPVGLVALFSLHWLAVAIGFRKQK